MSGSSARDIINYLLEQTQSAEASSGLHNELLAGLLVRCACQILQCCSDAQTAFAEGWSRSIAHYDGVADLVARMSYITDSSVPRDGVTVGAGQPPTSEEGLQSSALDSSMETSTEGGAAWDDADASFTSHTKGSRQPVRRATFPGTRNMTDSHVTEQNDSTQESQLSLQPEHGLQQKGSGRGIMNLTSADIERWIEDGGPAAIDSVPLPSTLTSTLDKTTDSQPQPQMQLNELVMMPGSSHDRASVPLSTTATSLARSTSKSARSSSMVSKLLQESIQTLKDVQSALLTSEFVLLVQMAGVSGVCRALLKSLLQLETALPESRLSVLVVEAPRSSASVSRIISQSGFAVLPAMSRRRGTESPWSSLFRCSRVPRAMVIESCTGRVACPDAIQAIHRKDASTFPWDKETLWSSTLTGAIITACSHSQPRAEEDVRGAIVLLLYVEAPAELPWNFPQLLKMWLAMYPTDAILCYTTGSGEKLNEEAGFLFIEPRRVPQAKAFAENATCCMMFSPHYQHLVMAVDIASLEPTASAWRLQDYSTSRLWRRLHEIEYSRLHSTPAFILLSYHERHDATLQQVLSKAVQQVYCEQEELRTEEDGSAVMYCFSSTHDRGAPSGVTSFMQEISQPQRRHGDVCALIVVSVPDMTVSQIPCSAVPDFQYVQGMIQAYFKRELTFSSLNLQHSSF